MNLSDVREQRILFTCLNWGSGHVARSIGLIRKLSEQGNSIFVHCSIEQKTIFEKYELPVNYLPGEKFYFRFKGDGNFVFEMLRNGFRFRKAIKKERILAESLVKKYEITLVLSDHCYGFCSSEVTSIFITHQVQLPPKSGRIAHRIHQKWLKDFSWIWIMDNEKERLAGILSNAIEKSSYIGWFSRFSDLEEVIEPNKIVGIVSGPEPYSKQLFCWILEKYGDQKLTIIASKKFMETPENVVLVTDWKQADAEILSAETIISRNGYSTLMDLKFLNKETILIPTPGQLEQEYLHTLNT